MTNIKAWYSGTKIGLSHIMRSDVNALMSGFLEIKKNELGSDIVNLFLHVAETTWYHFSFDENRLFMYSSNVDFNDAVANSSNIGKAGFGQYVVALGEENETLKFINEYRKNYYDIDEEYDLEFPDDNTLEEEEDSFETLQTSEEKKPEPEEATEDEDEDDGF